MPKLTGVFDWFKNLDTIPTSDLMVTLSIKGDPHTIENFLGNRILYPQTIPPTNSDLELDCKILLEALKRQPEVVFDKDKQNLVLPEEFTTRFPPFIKLVALLIDAIKPQGLAGLFMKSQILRRLGTIVSSPLAKQALSRANQNAAPTISINGEMKQLTPGIINLLPYQGRQFSFKIADSQEIIIPGGEMGIFIDLRG